MSFTTLHEYFEVSYKPNNYNTNFTIIEEETKTNLLKRFHRNEKIQMYTTTNNESKVFDLNKEEAKWSIADERSSYREEVYYLESTNSIYLEKIEDLQRREFEYDSKTFIAKMTKNNNEHLLVRKRLNLLKLKLSK